MILLVCKWLVTHTDHTLDSLEVVDVLNSLETSVSDGLLDILDLSRL